MAGREGIGPGYASPNLRWGLLLEDYPGATKKIRLVKGNNPLLHEVLPQGEDGEAGPFDNVDFCVAVITFPAGSGKPQALGYKQAETAEVRNADKWNVLSKKTLGRALKDGGYPDNMDELKGLMRWRERTVQIEMLGSAPGPIAAIGTGRPADDEEDDLDRAAVDSPEHVGGDDGDIGDEHVDDNEPNEATVTAMKAAIGALKGDKQKAVRDWAKAQGYSVTKPATEGIALAITAKAKEAEKVDTSTGEVQADHVVPAPREVISKVMAEAADDALVGLRSLIGADIDKPIAQWSDESIEAALEWAGVDA